MLLIAYYWFPWNNAGAFRWLHLSKYISIHTVITSKKAKGSFEDHSMPYGSCINLLRRFSLRPAVWALVMTPLIVFQGLKHEKIIITIPTEMLLIPAFILQLLGREVLIDLRDAIDRDRQPFKMGIPLYRWLYGRMKNKVAVWRFLDPKAVLIRHGYEDLDFKPSLFGPLLQGRHPYADYLDHLSKGYVIDLSGKVPGYATSSMPTLIYYNIPIMNPEIFHEECFDFEPENWASIAVKWMELLGVPFITKGTLLITREGRTANLENV